MFFGAETETLRRLAGEADELAGLLTETAGVLQKTLGLLPSIWAGPDAEAFSSLVSSDHLPRLNSAADRLLQASSTMRSRAVRQDDASR